MAGSVMGSIIATMDVTDGLLMCVSAEPQTAEEIHWCWLERTGRRKRLSVQAISSRLVKLGRRGLIAKAVQPSGRPTRYLITSAGEQYANQRYEEYAR